MKGVQEWILPVSGRDLPVADDEQSVRPVFSARQAVAQGWHQASGPPMASVAGDPGRNCPYQDLFHLAVQCLVPG